MRRQVRPELLDADLGTPADVAGSLRDLKSINAWLGGSRLTTQLLRPVAQADRRRSLSLLDVGAGDGHVPIAAKRLLEGDDVELRLTLLDRMSSHLLQNGTAAVVGNALNLPFRRDAFDVVSCNLLAHHFEPDQLILLSDELLRVARIAVLINDLVRSRLHLALTYAGLPLFRSRLTR